MQYVIIHFSCLRLVDGASRFVESLQGDQIADEVLVRGMFIRSKLQTTASGLARLPILPLSSIHNAQTEVSRRASRIALNLLLIGCYRFIQFASHVQIVSGGDEEPLSLTGVLP